MMQKAIRCALNNVEPLEQSIKKYYEAYDQRYKRIHEDGLLWFKNAPTPELLDWISVQNIPLEETILEVGCGEGVVELRQVFE